ncbi:cupredoxin domain-containing protein [Candidatus Saccharibacteria bacterium]|nr:cupredoxin domain-containing protein [Candidatus Saccharibacteria bacterium]
MDKLLILAGALLIIGLIVWWFFGKRKTEVVAATLQGDKQIVEIVVDGGYKPSVIELERGISTDIIFTRKDTSACFEEIVLPDFGVRTHLPVGKPYTITVEPKESGEYKYSCGMNMFFGKVIVK